MLIVTATLGQVDLSPLVRSLTALSMAYEWIIICPESVRAKVAADTASVRPRPRVIGEPSGNGLYGALNVAINLGLGSHEWFTYINDDDTLLPDFDDLASLHCLESNARFIAYGRVSMMSEVGLHLFDFPIARDPADVALLWACGVMPFTQQGMLMHRSVWGALKGFDESYRLSSDLDFWIRAYFVGFRFKFYNIPVASWRVRFGQLSATTTAVLSETERCLLAYFPRRTRSLKNTLAVARFRFFNIRSYFYRYLRTRKLTQSSVFR